MVFLRQKATAELCFYWSVGEVAAAVTSISDGV